MNRDAVEKWADALEFGDYAQTRGALAQAIGSAAFDSFCGLGVACAVFAKSRGHQIEAVIGGVHPLNSYLPILVAGWLGLSQSAQEKIVELNDTDKLTLPQIGTWVRDHLLKEE
jgi:hypothetical protein